MLQVLAGQHCQHHGHAYAIVGSQGSTSGLYPVIINVSFNGIGFEIVLNVRIFFTDHVHMCLKNDSRTIFVSGSCIFTDEEVSNSIFCPI
ncbi:hypothetical protein SDC9_201824 [bioreactor metagenome]|uniref:Uncharacterized protein n=1 Tax=bioreactor metagenome TaxID=1076179 RepID=A0A645IRZ2_9ZZZZ